MDRTDLENCRVVLVRPKIAANIGAVARVMRNMGLSDLALVRPEADVADPRAALLATHSQDLLENAHIVTDLGHAVADCAFVAGTSARTGGLFRKQTVGTPEMIMPQLCRNLATHKIALVFGSETNGLENEEVARCHYLIHIPTSDFHMSLNLSQAVAICLYELRKFWLSQNEIVSQIDVADFQMQERAYRHLQEALERIHFLYEPKGDSLMHALRHWLGRAQPSRTEINILHGLARQILWYCENSEKTNL